LYGSDVCRSAGRLDICCHGTVLADGVASFDGAVIPDPGRERYACQYVRRGSRGHRRNRIFR
jgi:hypothetical protein